MNLGTIVFVISAVLGLKKECPGGSSQCADNATCCQLTEERYGCCPMENAVCCNDHIHCCPINTKCSASLCIQNTVGNASVPAYSLKPNDVCPGGKFSCPDSSTCCETLNQTYACCPLKTAVCCEDKIHCCPQNSVCDVQAGKCTRKGIVSDLYNSEKNHALETKIATLGSLKDSENSTSVVCPGGKFQCPNGCTCCKLPTGNWGCCPFEKAICCSDHLHCCPKNSKCDVTSGSCIQETRNVSASLNVPAVKVDNQTCPDKTSCLDFMTCCSTGGEHYGCCPFPNAVCCDDKIHCCPQNSVCDVQARICKKSQTVSDFYNSEKNHAHETEIVKLGSLKDSENITSVVCPGGQFQCPNGCTCCKLPTGNWGCCPFEKAICCSDHLHCCPENFKCDVTSGSCIQGTRNVSASLNVPAVKVGNQICPDQTSCFDFMTCCSTGGEHYGCCPLPNAVCCDDKIHCCPQNSVCDVQAGRCTRKGIVFDVYNSKENHAYKRKIAKLGSLKDSKNITSVVCPGGEFQCPNGYTCCQLPTKDWGCCPFDKASCCSDHKHCCPENFKCDVTSGSCIQATQNVSARLNVPAVKISNQTCPDKTPCSDFMTCCSTGEKHYGCCHFSNAVCCEDNLHCCPENYVCNLVEKRCEDSALV